MEENKIDDWFREWFNTPYYHLLYRNRDEQEARHFMDHICDHLHLPPKARIIDVGCGKGRHASYLHSLGFEVTGIDLSANSIEEARAMETNGLSFFVHDMRDPFQHGNFDCALNLFTSIGYFEDLADNGLTVKACSQALRTKGILVIDFLNAEKAISNLVSHEKKQMDGISFEIQRVYEQGRIKKKITVLDNDKKMYFEEKVSALSLDDFRSYFSDSGLELINLFGNYSLKSFDNKKSDRLIMVAKKA